MRAHSDQRQDPLNSDHKFFRVSMIMTNFSRSIRWRGPQNDNANFKKFYPSLCVENRTSAGKKPGTLAAEVPISAPEVVQQGSIS